MTSSALALLAMIALAGCTIDLHLGARDAACDPFEGPCPCTETADCPTHFYCIPVSNDGAAFCEPPEGCNALPMRGLECPSNACNPAEDPDCDPAPACIANVCSNTGDACCTADLTCYPASCVGCCG